jgi:hypothetical protein
VRQREDPLPERHRWQDVLGEIQGGLAHLASQAGGADAAALAGEGHQVLLDVREALGRLKSELYPPLKEEGAVIRYHGPGQLPPLIDAKRRNAGRARSAPRPEPRA